MNAFLQKALLSQPTGRLPGFRYVALVMIVALFLGSSALAVAESSRTLDRGLLPLLCVNLLAQHLTSQFRWPGKFFLALRLLYFLSAASLVIYFPICLFSWFHH